MRLRLQKAIKELVTTDKPLTEIALYNGFSDLKSFNTRFREMLKILPSEYRMKMDQSLVSPEYYDILSIPASEPLIMGKLEEYMKI
jgi:xylan 1,4-beta-xylosidase